MTFFETGYGWITPRGKIISGIGLVSHINILRTDPDIDPKLLESFDDVQNALDSCQELAEKEGNSNAEWHTYDIAVDRLIAHVYSSGYVRLYVDKKTGFFGAEGKKLIVHSRMDKINQLKEQFEQETGIELKLKIQTW